MDGFRYRSDQPTRLETLSDAVFGFSLTLLVVSLEAPRTFTELMDMVYGFVPFAFCFMLFVHIWYLHSRYFKRYAMQDVPTVWLNSILLFLIMFFVYPLKFLVEFIARMIAQKSILVTTAAGNVEPMLYRSDSATMLLLFSLGYIAIHLTFVVMHVRVVKLREKLGLNDLEMFDTRTALWEHVIYVSVASSSVAIAGIGGADLVPYAGWFYVILGPLMGTYGAIRGRKRGRLWPVVTSA